jgi:hypothetical protein
MAMHSQSHVPCCDTGKSGVRLRGGRGGSVKATTTARVSGPATVYPEAGCDEANSGCDRSE